MKTIKQYSTKSIVLISIFLLLCIEISAQQISNCATCGTKLLTETQLKNKSMEELSLLRNEVYARKGFVFSNAMYQRHFENQDWYVSAASNGDVKPNDIEAKNIALLKSLEQKIQTKRDAAIRDLKQLKTALNNNDMTTIRKMLNQMNPTELENYDVSGLKETFNELKLESINWNKGRGLYKVEVDDGYQVSRSEISIDGDTIIISTGMYRNSELFGDFDDGYSDYQSEGEYATWWIFEMRETGIVFKEIGGAG